MLKKILLISLAIIALTGAKANAQYLCGSTGYIYRNQGFCNANCSLNGNSSPCEELSTSSTSAPSCPSGYQGFVFDPNNNTTYAITTTSQFWTAFDSPASSSSMAIIPNSSVNSLLNSILIYYDIPNAWIGLYNPQMSTDYNTVNPDRPYSWADGSTPTYYNWANGEPNNALPSQDLSLLPESEYGQHWVEMESNGEWNDIGYNYTYPSSQNYAPYLPALVQFNNQLSCVSGVEPPTPLTTGQENNLANRYCGGDTANCYLCSDGANLEQCQSGNTYLSGTAYLCPAGQTQCNKNTNTPQCPSDSTYNSSLNECTAPPVCPSGYTFINNKCSETLTTQSTCPTGSTYNSSSNECVTTDTTAATCPSGTSYDSSTDQCVTTTTATPTCPSGTTYGSGQCTAAPICPTNYTYDSSTGECTETLTTQDSCPTGYTMQSNGTCLSTVTTTPTCSVGNFSNGQCLSTPSCPSGYSLYGGTCINNISVTYTCPSGTSYNSSAQECQGSPTITCPSGSTYNSSNNECEASPNITCPSGTSYNSSQQECTATVTDSCPSGTTYNSTNNLCETSPTVTPVCPSGSTYNSSDNECLATPSCPSGYTLSGDTCTSTVTASCQSGYNWNGSTCSKTTTATAMSNPQFNGGSAGDENGIYGIDIQGNGLYRYDGQYDGCGGAQWNTYTASFLGFSMSGSIGWFCTYPIFVGEGNAIQGFDINRTCNSWTKYSCGRNTCTKCSSWSYSESSVGAISVSGASVSGTTGPGTWIYTGGNQMWENGGYSYPVPGPYCPSGYVFNSSNGECETQHCYQHCYRGSCSESCYWTGTTTPATYGSCMTGFNNSGSECVENGGGVLTFNPVSVTTTSTSTASPTCPSGYTLSGDICTSTVPAVCPSGTYYSSSYNECVANPTNNISCPSGTSYNASLNSCTTSVTDVCPSGSTYNSSNNECEANPNITCPSGTSYNSSVQECQASPNVTCPSGTTLTGSGSSYNCVSSPNDTCPSGYTLSGDTCVSTVTASCPSGTLSNDECITSAECPTNYTYNTSTDLCDSNATATPICPTGYTLSANGECLSSPTATPTCPNGTTFSASNNDCQSTATCPTNYTLTNNECVENTFSTPNVCPSGYVLVGSQCVYTSNSTPICPSGYTLESNGTCSETLMQAPTCSLSGFTFVNGACVSAAGAMSCSSGYNLVNTSCPSGTTYQSGECIWQTTASLSSSNWTSQSISSPNIPVTSAGVTLTFNVQNTGGVWGYDLTTNTSDDSSGTIWWTSEASNCNGFMNQLDGCGGSSYLPSENNTVDNIYTVKIFPNSQYLYINGTQIASANVSMSNINITGIDSKGSSVWNNIEISTPPNSDTQCVSYSCPLGNNDTCVNTGSGYYCSQYSCVNYNSSSAYTINNPPVNANNPTNNGQTNSAGECLGQIYIFSGQALQCRDPGIQTGWGGGCCTADKKWFGLSNCNSQEKLLAEQRAADDCTMVGTYCAQSFLGYCLQTDQTWCCFPSLLANIIQQQTRAMQGLPIYGWGTPTSPNCIGYTPQQFQAINFSKINLSAFYNSIEQQTSSLISNAATNAVNKFQQSLGGN